MNDKCIICNSEYLEQLKTTKIEVFSTGDRKKFEPRNRKMTKVICKDCGTVQFLQSEDYKSAIDEVYKNYDVLHDKMWSANESECKPRLQVIYEKISKAIYLPEIGNMMDIGCGGGESLFQFNHIYPKWDLYGMDIGEQFRERVTGRNGVKKFFTSLEEIKNSKIKFDFITINDVLSLADNPVPILLTVYNSLKEDGYFFVKEANFQIHPWLLYEVGCCFFCTKDHIENVVRHYGFDLLNVNFELEKKEIGIFCKKGPKSRASRNFFQNSYELNKKIYSEKIAHLNNVIDIVQKYVDKNVCIGIFGISIAGIWISEIITKSGFDCESKKIFYIEEDEDNLQRKIGVNGFPIYQLEDITDPAVIFLPFPQYVAENIKRRCEKKYNYLEFVIFE